MVKDQNLDLDEEEFKKFIPLHSILKFEMITIDFLKPIIGFGFIREIYLFI